MRFIFSTILISVLSNTAALAQFGYGPEVGIGMSTMLFKPDNVFTASSTASIFSGKVGGIIDAGFTKHIYFQSGLFLSRKGQKRNYSFYLNDSVNDAEQQTLYLHYIDLPLTMLFKTGVQGKARVILGVGATLSYLAWGREIHHIKGVGGGVPFDIDINRVFKQGTVIRSFDIGTNIVAGYELPTGWYFKAYFTSGVKDLGYGTEINKNRIWGIAAGYLIGKGRNINKDAEGLIDKSTD